MADYEADIRSWDWAGLEADAEPQEAGFGEEEGKRCAFLGTVFALVPSGKFYTPWANSNVTEAEADDDAGWYEALDQVAQEHGAWVESGEGDPCDLFVCWPLSA